MSTRTVWGLVGLCCIGIGALQVATALGRAIGLWTLDGWEVIAAGVLTVLFGVVVVLLVDRQESAPSGDPGRTKV